MNNIKYINCFGTSYTAGGGYEFDTSGKGSILHDLYNHLNEELSMFNFSWPGQLSKLLGTHKIQVNNYAVNGYGNEKMYRDVYDIINSPSFERNEHLFILEFSGVGRQEIYFTPFNDYIIFNFQISDPFNPESSDIAHRYHYDDSKKKNTLQKNKKIIGDYHKLVYDHKERHRLLERNNNFFVRYLHSLDINYLFGQHPYYSIKSYNDKFDFDHINNHSINFISQNTDDIIFGLDTYYRNEGLTITSETFGVINDHHASLLGNKNISINVFNSLIDYEYIKDIKKPLLPLDTQFCKPL